MHVLALYVSNHVVYMCGVYQGNGERITMSNSMGQSTAQIERECFFLALEFLA